MEAFGIHVRLLVNGAAWVCWIATMAALGAAPRATAGEPMFAPPPLASPSAVDIERLEAGEREPAFDAAPCDASAASLWLVNTRNLPTGACELEFEVSRYECGLGWRPASVEEFLASDDPRVTTAFFVNGNNVNSYYADVQGRAFFERFTGGCPAPARCVIWSWLADKSYVRYLVDARAKLPRIDFESMTLASFIGMISPDVPVGVVGYSFGARLVGGTLHALGGGEMAGRVLRLDARARRAPLRAALVAGALDCHWFMPQRKLDAALVSVDRVLVCINPDDIVLKFYPVLYGRDGPNAMGLVGIGAHGISDDQLAKVEPFHTTRLVDAAHRLQHYLASEPFMARVRGFVLAR